MSEQKNFTKYIVTIFKYVQLDDLSFKWEKFNYGYAFISEEEYGPKLKVSIFEEDKRDGEGEEYYDSKEKRLKYKGEYENDKYDGAGVFYSYDGNVEVKINNLSRNKANGKCKLFIKLNSNNEILKEMDFNFKDLKKEFELDDKKFCVNVANYLLPDYKNLLFNKLSIEDKLLQINNKLDKLYDLLTYEEDDNNEFQEDDPNSYIWTFYNYFFKK